MLLTKALISISTYIYYVMKDFQGCPVNISPMSQAYISVCGSSHICNPLYYSLTISSNIYVSIHIYYSSLYIKGYIIICMLSHIKQVGRRFLYYRAILCSIYNIKYMYASKTIQYIILQYHVYRVPQFYIYKVWFTI